MTPVDAELGGYAEVRGSWQFGVDGQEWNLVERVRPRFEIAPAERLTAQVVVEAGFQQGRDVAFETADLLLDSPVGDLLDAASCTYVDTPVYGQASEYLRVERLHVDLNLPAIDLTIGRQAVNWGSGLVFRPSDLYTEVVATEPWRERRGVNAIKAEVPIGDHSIVGLVALDDDLTGLDAEEPELPISGALRVTARVGGMDLAAVGRADWLGRWFAGADLRGTLGVGWWVEGGWRDDGEGVDGAVEVVAGVDYSFPVLQVLYVAAEYRYDGSGSLPDDYDWSTRAGFSTMPFDCAFLPDTPPGTRTSLGVHYLDGSLRLGVTEDVSVAGVVIANVLDGTGIVVPNVSVLAGPRVTVSAGAQIPFGVDGEYRPGEDVTTVTVGTATADLSSLLPVATAQAWVRYAF